MKPVLTVLTGFFFVACQGNSQQNVDLKTRQDSVSYSIGLDIGNNLKTQSIDVNTQALAAGIADAVSGNQAKMTDEEVESTMMAFQMEMMEKQTQKARELGEKHKIEGDEFLAANKTKQGVVTLPSGLQYQVINQGTGRKPKAGESVTVNYVGTLVDGTEFDSSFKRGVPATFGVGGVIKGFSEALMLMPVGSKWKIFIPADLAYGDQGAGDVIPPNATIIFEVELLSVK